MKLKPVQKLAGWGLELAPFALPVKPLRQARHWMVFNHPHPSYAVHIMLVPRKNVTDWMSVEPGQMDLESTKEFIELTQSIILEYNLIETGYRLILNGGSYQTFPHMHVHLVSGAAMATHKE